MKQIARYLLGFGALLWSCDSGEIPKQQAGEEYFPLQVGYFQVYSVEETRYANEIPSLISYELKSEIVDSFANQDGTMLFVIHRSKRSNESEPWVFMETWSARSDEYEAIVNEGNISFVKLSFPMYKNKSWDGNALNSSNEDFYSVESVNVPFEFENGEVYSDAVVVNMEENISVDEKQAGQEVYSKSIGLIYKSITDVVYCNDNIPFTEGGCLGLYKIESGYESVFQLKQYGQN